MNYFVKHWQGQFSVAKAFWPWYLFWGLIGLLGWVVMLNSDNGLERLFPLFTRFTFLPFYSSGIWWGCGVWRSCDNPKNRVPGSGLRNAVVKSIVCILFFEIIMLIPGILPPAALLDLHIKNYEISISPYLIAQAFLLIVVIGFVIYKKLLRRKH